MKRILIAEGVPLKNKGEEAIIRGICDFLFDNENVEIAVMDFVDKPTFNTDIKIFPIAWLYPYHRPMRVQMMKLPELSLAQKLKKYYYLVSFMWGDYGPANYLLKENKAKYQELKEYVQSCDYIFFGHDGAWGLYSVPVFLAFKKLGLKVGILGSGFNPRTGGLLKIIEKIGYRKVIRTTDFSFFRETNAFQYMKVISDCNPIVKLAPDPAFGMRCVHFSLIEKYMLENYPVVMDSRKTGKPIIGVTVCENSVVFNKAFSHIYNRQEKSLYHSNLIAYLLDRLIDRYNAFVIFLPHTIDEGRGNDVLISQEVIELMSFKNEAVIITENLDARFLKGVISWIDFLIGERTHSVIGSLSVATPFVMLTNAHDHRSNSIIGEVGNCKDLILDINKNRKELIEDIYFLFNKRTEIQNYLISKSNRLTQQLEQIRDEIL